MRIAEEPLKLVEDAFERLDRHVQEIFGTARLPDRDGGDLPYSPEPPPFSDPALPEAVPPKQAAAAQPPTFAESADQLVSTPTSERPISSTAAVMPAAQVAPESALPELEAPSAPAPPAQPAPPEFMPDESSAEPAKTSSAATEVGRTLFGRLIDRYRRWWGS